MHFEELKKFIRSETEHAILPSAMIKTLLKNNGQAAKSKIKHELQNKDPRYNPYNLDGVLESLMKNPLSAIRFDEEIQCYVLEGYDLLTTAEKIALVIFCNQRIENPVLTIDEINVEEIVLQFRQWLNSEVGSRHRQVIVNEKREVKELMEKLSKMDKKDPEFTDLVLYGLLPYYDTKFAKRVSTFPTFMNIKPFFKNYNYSDYDWNLIADMIFSLSKKFEMYPEQLGQWIEEFTAKKIHSRKLQCGSITPILHCINDSFPLINNRIMRTYKEFSDDQGWGDSMSQKLADYFDNIPKCQKLIDLLGMKEMNFEVFDLFCWWYDIKDKDQETDDDVDEADYEVTSKKPKEIDLKEFVNSLDLEKASELEHYRLRSPDRIRIRELLQLCQKCEWQLPNFQRYFDWKKTDIRDLLDSVFKDFYIGSLLLWEAGSDPQLKLIPILGARSPNYDVQTRMIILDGQQRITSLYYVIKGTPSETKTIKKPVYFYIDFGSYLQGHENGNIIMREQKLTWEESLKSLWFPFYELENYAKWTDDLSEKIMDGDNYNKVTKICKILDEKLKHFIDEFEIPYIVLPSSIELPQVADIFEKINTKGKSLSVFDILIATLSKYDIDLRRLWDDAIKKYPVFKTYNSEDKLPIYILQSIALYYHDLSLCGRDDLLKMYSTIIEPKDLAFDEVWDEMAEWVSKAIFKLGNHNDGFGVRDRRSLPYMPVIPILASLLRNVNDRKNKNTCHSKIKRWYWSSIFSEMYSSGVDSQLTADYRGMAGWKDEYGKTVPGWFDDDARTVKSVENFSRGLLNTINLRDVKNGAIFKGILSLVGLEGAQDFDTGQHAVNESSDRHHIFPKQQFSKQFSNVNSILNITWLSEDTNRKIIRDKKPSVYTNKFLGKNHNSDQERFQKEILDRHFISKNAFEYMLNDDFDNFIKEREKAILKKIAEVVGIPSNEMPSSTLIKPDTPFSNESAIIKTIQECQGHIYWIDKYFDRKGLEWLSNAVQQDGKTKSIKILTAKSRPTLEKTERLKDSFKKFRVEMKHRGITSELRIFSDSKTAKDIHDRWLITKGTAYIIPSTDTIARGQASVIARGVERPNFEEWWEDSLDVFEEWHKIQESRHLQDGKSG